MISADRLRDQLSAIYELKYQRQGKTLGDLSEGIGFSKTYISLFLNGKLAQPSEKLLQQVWDFIKKESMTSGDGRLLMDILKLLDRADDPASILAALLHSRGRG